MRNVLILSLTVCLNVTAIAQAPLPDGPSPGRSKTMLRFLKPGDLVGVQSFDGTTSVVVSTYSEDQFELARAILKRGRTTINAKKFAAENSRVQKSLEDYLARNQGLGIVEDRLSIIPLMRTSLGKVSEVGKDCILVEFDGVSTRRCVIAKSSIGKIYLDAIPIRFAGPRRVASSANR